MPEHSIRIYEALKQKGVPSKLYFHQGGHGGPPPMTMMNRWFTRYLHGVENGVENDPRAWVVREDAKPQDPTAYDDYPNPEATPVKLHLNQGGHDVASLSLSAARIAKVPKRLSTMLASAVPHWRRPQPRKTACCTRHRS